ncbi:winged helix-turn-helix transcriptional regulator [Candidatus Bathyarchaeota archaeon]|nr:winged helix-turn-helix transcriptional regulator [Candidatus Bathyarchaeota archaeon]
MEELLDRVARELSFDTSPFKILTYLSFRGASLPSQIAEETGIPPGTVRPALRSLLEKGFVIQQDDGAYRSKVAFTDIISDLYLRCTAKKQ